MKEQNLNNYHWTEGDITKYTTDYLTKEFGKHQYKINNFKCEAYIHQRMGKIGLVYFINMDLTKNQRKIEIVDFDQFSDYEDFDSEDKTLFEDIFENYKKDAIKNCSNCVLEEKENKNIGDKKEIVYYDVKKNVKTDEILSLFEITYVFNCKKEEMIDFLTNKEFIQMWTCGDFQDNGKNMTLLSQFVFDDMFINDDRMTCKFKHCSWNDFVDLCIIFAADPEGCKVILQYKNIEKQRSENLPSMWEQTMIKNICFRFSYKIVSVRTFSK